MARPEKRNKRIIRHRKIRAKIRGTANVPRLCVFRSNKHIYAQIINDENNQTIFSISDKELKTKGKKKNTEIAFALGELLAKKLKEMSETKHIEKIVFDRSGYKYHGRVKALAEGARKAGLKF